MRRNLMSSMVLASAALAAFLACPEMPVAAPSEALLAQATMQEKVETREKTTVRESSPTTSTTSSRTEIIVQDNIKITMLEGYPKPPEVRVAMRHHERDFFQKYCVELDNLINDFQDATEAVVTGKMRKSFGKHNL